MPPDSPATQPTVFVIDDDEAVRDSVRWLIETADLQVETYASAADFLDAYDPTRTGCILVDVRMPGMSGLEMQQELAALPPGPPLIVVTGHGDVQMAVHAMKEGAFDFVEKPFNDRRLLDLVHKAVEISVADANLRAEQSVVSAHVDLLTPREREVLEQLIKGESNKGVANALGISDKTVEAHRAKVMDKLQASSFADLMKKVMLLDGVAK